MKIHARLFALILVLFAAARTSADVITVNFNGALPADYGWVGLGQFNNTTLSGSFSYDTAGILPANWQSGVTGVGNVAFDIQFSNGYHGSWTSTLLDYSPWVSGYDLIATAGPQFVIGGTYYGNFAFVPVNLLDSGNNATGVQLNSLSFTFTNDAQNLYTGYTSGSIGGQVGLNNAGLGIFNTGVASTPDATSTLGLIAAAVMGLAAVRRRFGAN